MNKLMLLTLLFSGFAQAQIKTYGLQDSDQKYFKNGQMEGNNQYERIDMNVTEINKLHGEVEALKGEIATLKKEIELLKNKK